MPVPNTSFGTATSAIPLSELDANFATPITLGNTAIQLGNTVTTLNNMTLANVTISSGNVTITNVSVTTANVSGTANVSTLVVVGNATVGGNTTVGGNVTLSGGTANGVAYLNTSKALTTGSALTFDGSALAVTGTLTATQSTADTSAIAVVASAATRTKVFGATGSTTAGMYGLLSNTGGSMLFGVENSGGGNIVTGSAAYSAYFGTNTNTPVSIAVNSAQVAVFDASGNLGLGVTPSAWAATNPIKAIQVGRGGSISYGNDSASTNIVAGAYLSATNQWTKIGTVAAAKLALSDYDGSFLWSRAASGSGNFTYTDVMTLDASGNLLVGTTDSSDTANAGFRAQPSGVATSTLTASGTGDSTMRVYSTGAGAYRFFVRMDGTIFATSIVITAISDQRLKENVRDIDTGLNSIMSLKPRRFDWKDGKGQDKKNAAGFIAQEFEDVFPECVGTSKAGADGIEYKSINHETLIPTLVKAIQEQQALITQLTARITALEGA